MAPAPRARKIPKQIAMERFIEVTAELLDLHPLAEVTDHLIADTAQISRSSIYRYFNTRVELFDIVLDTLVPRYLTAVKTITTPFAERREGTHISTDIFAINFTLSTKIFAIGNYLASENYRSELLTNNFTKIVDTWVQQLVTAGAAPRTARALALQSLGLGFGRANAANLVSLSTEEIMDVFQIMVNSLQNHAELTTKFGWTDTNTQTTTHESAPLISLQGKRLSKKK